MSDTMFPEPMDQMDRAMQRMDKKAWAEADAEIALLKAQLAEEQEESKRLRCHFNDATRRAENAEAALVEADKDAARYRWLRDRAWPFEFKGDTPEDADAAIDKAIAQDAAP